MPLCAVPTCDNSSSRKVKAVNAKGWHTIPSDQILRTKWMVAVRRKPPYPDDEYIQLCGLHFEDDCFERDFNAELMNTPKRFKLNEDAVPSRRWKLFLL